jgi:hypothetical protein
MNHELLDYYQEIKDNRIILVFKGALSQDVLAELGGLVRLRFASESETMIMRRLFAVLIEMAQNVLHYSAEREKLPFVDREAGVGVIMVRDGIDSFMVTSGNLITQESAVGLEAKCQLVSTMNKEDLKQLYLAQRKKDPDPESKGAGLGFIDIARKSSRPIQYNFAPVDADHAFFALTATLDKTATATE